MDFPPRSFPQAKRVLPAAELTPLSATLDASPGAPPKHHAAPLPVIGFIDGSGPQISGETASLLRTRLRAAAGVLGLAFGLFLLWRLFLRVETGTIDPFSDKLSFYFHIAVTVVLGATFFLLCRKCAIPLKVLHFYELAVFGMPVAYFIVYQYDMLRIAAREMVFISPLAYWMGIVFTYAIFIPNNWRRAALFIGVMCSLPVALLVLLYFRDAGFAAMLADNPAVLIETIIMMGVTFLSATYGTHVINKLRVEAFEARQLGQYKLCRLIGSGGMGEVYLAEHQMMKRPVAIKLIRPGKAADPQALARFEREVRATARLSHWNTIEIFDYGRTDDGTFYYVMEYLPGLSLHDLVEKHGPLPPARVVHLLTQTCDALSEAHSRGLVHRDLKPGNIFSAQRGGFHDVAKLLDFGLAKPLSAGNVGVQLTQDGSITGSPMYMSPEQALGDNEPDERSDIYSLGAVAYYLLTGNPPFVSDKAIRIILAHAHDPVVPPRQLRPDIPVELEQVVLRCLAKEPAERYPSAQALRLALSESVAGARWGHHEAAHWWQANGGGELHAEAMSLIAI